MMGQPLVSIVLPTYNRAHYLPDAIQSVLDQTYENWELIVVDDGSTDETKELIKNYQDTHTNILYIQQEHQGVSTARNLGISHATGQYVAFLDSDDVFLPDKLEIQIPYFSSGPAVKMTYSAFQHVTDIRDISKISLKKRTSPPPHELWNNIYPDLLTIQNNIIVTPSVIVDRAILLETGGFDPSMAICEDIDLWRRVARDWQVAYADIILVLIRVPVERNIPFLQWSRARLELYRKARLDDPSLNPKFVQSLYRELFTVYTRKALSQRFSLPFAAWFGLRLLTRLSWHDRLSIARMAAKKVAKFTLLKIPAVRSFISRNRADTNLLNKLRGDLARRTRHYNLLLTEFNSLKHERTVLLRKAYGPVGPGPSEFNPLVSIIIPVYNGSAYLRQAIDSALAQTYSNIEIIVVNDGSNDFGRTRSIALSYKDSIRYMEKTNGGVATALNLGIREMAGQYFSWLSHDDFYVRDKIKTQIQYLRYENDIENVVFYSDYEVMDQDGTALYKCEWDHELLEQKPLYGLLRGYIHGCSLLLPARLFQKYGLFDESLRTTQDYDLWFRMIREVPFKHIPRMLVRSRWHEDQDTKKRKEVVPEGNRLWTRFTQELSSTEMIQCERTIPEFYFEMAEFLSKSPYSEARAFAKRKLMDEINDVKVTAIIPFRNHIDSSRRSIESALTQSHRKLEILVIDDGSSDDVGPVRHLCESDDRCKLIRQEGGGPGRARNLGIQHATGEYIAFLDSGDAWDHEKITQQLGAMVAKESQVSHTSYTRVWDNGVEEIVHSGTFSGQVFPQIIGDCVVATPTVMVHRSVLHGGLNFLDTRKGGEDTILWIKLAAQYPLYGLDVPLAHVSVVSESVDANLRTRIAKLSNIYDFVRGDPACAAAPFEIARLLQSLINSYEGLFLESGGSDEKLFDADEIFISRFKYRKLADRAKWIETEKERLEKQIAKGKNTAPRSQSSVAHARGRIGISFKGALVSILRDFRWGKSASAKQVKAPVSAPNVLSGRPMTVREHSSTHSHRKTDAQAGSEDEEGKSGDNARRSSGLAVPARRTVLHISREDLASSRFNGLGVAPFLSERKWDTRMLVWSKQSAEPLVQCMASIPGSGAVNRAAAWLERKIGIQSNLFPHAFTLPLWPAFRKASVIHYHVLQEYYFSLLSLPLLTRMKPSVWTLHDPWALTGHCNHPLQCTGWQTGCGNCPHLEYYPALTRDLTAQNFYVKNLVYSASRLDIVVASRWMQALAQSSPLTSRFPIHLIPFGVDVDFFSPGDSIEAKRDFGIESDHLVLSFRAESGDYMGPDRVISANYKGLDHVIPALQQLQPKRLISLLIVGHSALPEALNRKFPTVRLGWVRDAETMRRFYRATDLFLTPSNAESFGMMAVEAMAAGTPVISMEGTALPAVTFAPEVGAVFKQGRIDEFVSILDRLLMNDAERKWRGMRSREVAKAHYDIRDYVRRIAELYEYLAEKGGAHTGGDEDRASRTSTLVTMSARGRH